MAGQYGIKETKDALVFGVALQKAVAGALKDGKIDLGDIDEVWSVIGPLKDAVNDGYMIPAELGDLEPHEWDELVAVAAPLVDSLLPDQLEEYIWDTLDFVKKVLKWVGVIK